MLRKALEDYNLNGRVFRPGNLTVSELGDLWYADEVEHSALTTNGRNDYRNVLRQIREHPLGPQDVVIRGFIIDSVTGALTEV